MKNKLSHFIKKTVAGAIIRYILSQFKALVIMIVNFFIWPFIYVFRKRLREKHRGSFFWKFLNNKLDYNLDPTDEPNDYGDPYFFEHHFKDSYFWLAYRWSLRNPWQNGYYLNKILGINIDVRYKVTSQRDVPHGLWRTIKKKKDGEHSDKYGNDIDYARAILGKQWQEFTIDGVYYFRKSATHIRKIGNRLFIWEYKFGFENINWALQNHFAVSKLREETLIEYKEYLKNKNQFKKEL